jgi:hypothetical protein
MATSELLAAQELQQLSAELLQAAEAQDWDQVVLISQRRHEWMAAHPGPWSDPEARVILQQLQGMNDELLDLTRHRLDEMDQALQQLSRQQKLEKAYRVAE